MPAGNAAASACLLRWYEREKRELPWRASRDPYRILVSEVMLQQTRADTVIPYYQRFLEHFPDAASLARAETEEVLGLWSGLGYYGRARRLQEAARAVEAAGGFPRNVEGLERLPGIGPYTAAAVASIAFDEPAAVLDGNAIRVLSRWTGDRGDPRKAAVRRRLLDAGRALLDPHRPGDSNQAIMELGATICSPRAPRCAECPLESDCVAAVQGDPASYPTSPPRRSPDRRSLLAAVVEREGRYLLCRRPDDSPLLAGMWEIPWVESGGDEAASRGLARKYGGRWRLGESSGTVRHAITHRALEVEVRRARRTGRRRREAPAERWLAPGELDRTPLSSLVKKVLGRL